MKLQAIQMHIGQHRTNKIRGSINKQTDCVNKGWQIATNGISLRHTDVACTLLIKHQAYGVSTCRYGSKCILNAGNTANFNSGSQSFCLILGWQHDPFRHSHIVTLKSPRLWISHRFSLAVSPIFHDSELASDKVHLGEMLAGPNFGRVALTWSA